MDFSPPLALHVHDGFALVEWMRRHFMYANASLEKVVALNAR